MLFKVGFMANSLSALAGPVMYTTGRLAMSQDCGKVLRGIDRIGLPSSKVAVDVIPFKVKADGNSRYMHWLSYVYTNSSY